MKLVPKKKEDWTSLFTSTIKGGALITDFIFTRGAVQFLVGRAYDERMNKTLRELRRLPEELKKEIKDKISQDYLNSQEFIVFISNALTQALAIKNIEKLGYFRSAIINGIIRLDIKEGKKQLFIDSLSNLSVDSLLLLKLISESTAQNKDARISVHQLKQRGNYDDINYLMANLRSLERYHLITIIRPTGVEGDYGGYFIIYGEFGKNFISFIRDYQQ